MSNNDVAENLKRVRRRIAEAAVAVGRNPEEVRLVAVSKTVDVHAVDEAFRCGQCAFGENRAQELARKHEILHQELEWHMIGHLQRNKVRDVVKCASWIHSVDSEALLKRIDRVAGEEGRHPLILIQVNVSGEPSKSGVSPEEATALVGTAASCGALTCRGLMTMAPLDATDVTVHRVFGELRELRDQLEKTTGTDLPELSMGMSSDFVQAVAEGATMVRIGTAVFGSRSR